MRVWTTGILVALLGASGCGSATSTTGASATSGDEAAAVSQSELPAAPTVTGAEARALVAEGAFLLDVTPPPRNAQSEIEGRTNIPLPELRDRLDEVPRDQVIVAYCLGGRGSPRAGAILQAEGYDVRVLGARLRWFEGLEDAVTSE